MTAPSFGLVARGRGSDARHFDTMADLAGRAEAAGFASVWTNELYTHSATVGMAVLAGATRRVTIGSGIAYGVGRSPLVWAAEARDLDRLSNGRLLLGLGNGTKRMMRDWHGVDGSSPAARIEEFVEVFHRLWRLDRGPVDFDGRFYRVHVAPIAGMEPPLRERLPVYLAGVNPRMIESAGRVADGLIGHPMFTGRYIDEVVRPAIGVGAAARGRDAATVDVVRQVMCSVDPDPTTARARLAFAIAQYAASRVFAHLFDVHGWSRARDAITRAVQSGDPAAIVRAVPDDIIDAIGIAGHPAELPELLNRRWGQVGQVTLGPPPWGLTDDESIQTLQTLTAAFGGAEANTTTKEEIKA